ncbi:hypothetical protein E1B28_001769 [Marasmius oreades]|uniref:G-protein coupled receptors family 2 profile 2 domain-containing protein n=1 Tax=Marasmius oreades TaxID=181124 RepID=A0A9P7V494_9AGAR|nr:uncharacterized protein E1B28_001769 [Marasmius oreades]KAG7099976.1 hypothetical protein E1B28_001769 [Marasmius oreades]
MFIPRATADEIRPRYSISYDAVAYLSISLCMMVIFTSTFLSIHPLSKQKSDRVSFRIMNYALCGTVVYLIGGFISNRVSGQTACRVGGSLVIFGLHVSTFLFFCIGLNLQLVMIHGIDGTKAEKYYVGGSLFLAISLGVVTYLSKQLVYNPAQNACLWYDPDPVRTFIWRVGIWLAWNFLAMAGELVTFISVIIFMARAKVFETSRPGGSTTHTTHSRSSALHQFPKSIGPKQYRNVVLRIALYPLSSLATSGLMALGTVFTQAPIKGSTNRPDINVMSTLRIVYLSRGTIYALVAVADPAITQGMKMLYRRYIRRQTPTPLLDDGAENVEVRSLTRHKSGSGVRLEDSTHSSNGSEPQSSFHQSRSNGMVLPTMPKAVALLPLQETQLDTCSNYGIMDARSESESQVEDSTVQYSHSQLRQL